MLALAACQAPGGGDGGLVVVSDTAQVGPPPACNAAAATTGEDSDSASDSSEDSGGASDSGALSASPRGGRRDLSARTGRVAAADPGTSFCAQFTSQAACDGTPRMDGEALIGECRWVRVVPVLSGTCDATQLYDTCVHVPVDGRPCEAPGSCGQIGLGVYGRAGCDGTIEVIVVPPGQAFCASPTDWPLCWPRDDGEMAPECSCICS